MDLGCGTEEGLRLLAEQKTALINLLDKPDTPDCLNGLLNLIDHIQDTLVDKNGIPEDIVFPK